MADHPTRSGGGSRHLDASGPREVVYCHQCDNEWYQDESGLSCPRCQSEITEIVRNSGTNGGFHDSLTTSQITAESDPRPANDESPTPPGFHSLHNLQIPTKQILKSMSHKGQEALCCFLEPSGRVMPRVDLEVAADEEIRCLKKIPTMLCVTSKI